MFTPVYLSSWSYWDRYLLFPIYNLKVLCSWFLLSHYSIVPGARPWTKEYIQQNFSSLLKNILLMTRSIVQSKPWWPVRDLLPRNMAKNINSLSKEISIDLVLFHQIALSGDVKSPHQIKKMGKQWSNIHLATFKYCSVRDICPLSLPNLCQVGLFFFFFLSKFENIQKMEGNL